MAHAVAIDNVGDTLVKVARWFSSDTTVATVSAEGRVTGVAPGMARVRAWIGRITDRATIVVSAALVSSVTVTLTADSIPVGQTTMAVATVLDGSGRAVRTTSLTWSSSNPAVASVSATGLVTAHTRGVVAISALTSGVRGQAALKIAPRSRSEPTYSSSDKLLVTDNFDSYDGVTSGTAPFTARYPLYRALGVNDETIPLASVVSLPTGRGGIGHALRLSYGGPTGASDIIVGTDSRLDRVGQWNGTLPEVAGPYTHFFFSTWIRFSRGADPAGYDASGVKGIMLWHTGNQRYQAAPHRLIDYSDDSAYADTRWDVGPPHPPNATTHLNHWKTPDGTAPHFSAYNDGQWHRFTVEMYATDDPAGHRGERLWLDGVLMFDNVDNVGDLSWGTDYDYSHPVTHFMVFGNYIRGAIAALSPHFTVDFDDWTAWTN